MILTKCWIIWNGGSACEISSDNMNQSILNPWVPTCIWHTQYIIFLSFRCLYDALGKSKFLRDLRKRDLKWKQLLLAPEILRFFNRLLTFHCCDIIHVWISNYFNLSEIDCNKEALLWPVRKWVYVHVCSSRTKACNIWRLLLDTHFQWKCCGTQHTQCSGTQGVN